jgi:hypothetical protein
MAIAIVALLVAFLAFILWRYRSVVRGARDRDEVILERLEVIGEPLRNAEPIDPATVRALAAKPEVRRLLYAVLERFERLDLFPEEYTTVEEQGKALLAYWMMHPNELQDAPAEIELVESVPRQIGDTAVRFLVYRYRMLPGHWAGPGWILGVAGPFVDGEAPFSGIASAFSKANDAEGSTTPAEVADWFLDLMLRTRR